MGGLRSLSIPRRYREDITLVEEYTRRLGRPPKILNVGSGPGKVEGYLNVDRLRLEGVDVVADLNHVPWPFKDNRFEIVLCNHYIEHVQDIVATMEEIHRVGQPGCRVVIRTPYFANFESFRDPTHRWHLTWQSFDHFVPGTGLPQYTSLEFRIISKELTFPHPWRHPGHYLFRLHIRTYEKYFSHLFPGTWLHIQLEVEK